MASVGCPDWHDHGGAGTPAGQACARRLINTDAHNPAHYRSDAKMIGWIPTVSA
jgi:hypothetical protein